MLLLLSFYWFVVVSGCFVADIIVLCVGWVFMSQFLVYSKAVLNTMTINVYAHCCINPKLFIK